jgi:general nucleoside transport system ATP-binding protein
MSETPSPPPSSTPAIELTGINKRFGAVHANKDVSLTVMPGTVHGIVGENGAGKSTLMSILYGFYAADSGEIRIKGTPLQIKTSSDAIAAGIGMVHQHFMLVETMSVIENVLLGAEGGAILARGDAHCRAAMQKLADDYGLEVDPDAIVGELSVGLQQRVEIIKTLVRGADILILDEPTAVLTPSEADQLFELIRALRDQGKTVILITHKLREIMAATDFVSIMRRGEMVAHLKTSETSPPEIAEAMVGRKVLLKVDKGPARPGKTVLTVENLVVKDRFGVPRVDGVSFELKEGEIVGIAGVAGNGQSELLEALSGMRRCASGTISMQGVDVTLLDAGRTRKNRMFHVPEDRQRAGLVMPFAAYESGVLGHHREDALGAGLFIHPGMMRADVGAKMEAYDVRPRAPDLKTAKFSGGNQQKLILAREIERDPTILLVGQPTRGVDIGAIEFIHKQLITMRNRGKAILLVSVELDEIMSLSDRIIVMCGGKITGVRKPSETNEKELGLLMAGIMQEAA